MRKKYIDLTYIGRGTYSGDDLIVRHMETVPVLFEQANMLVANFPDWWEVGKVFEDDLDQEVTLKYSGIKPYNGDGITVNPDECVDVTEGKAKQLLGDFPDWWERIIDDNDLSDKVEDTDKDNPIWWKPVECVETNRVSIVVIQGQNIKNLKSLLKKLSFGISKRVKLYELFLVLDEDEKNIRAWNSYINRVDGMVTKVDEWASSVSHIVDHIGTDYLWVLDGDVSIPNNWDDHLQRMLQIIKKHQAAAIAPLTDGAIEGELSLNWISAMHSSESVDILEKVKDTVSFNKLEQAHRTVLGILKQKELIYNVRDLPVGCTLYRSELFKGVNGFECDRKYKGAALALRFQETGHQCMGYTRMVIKVRSCRECV